ncbi:MAG TPA: rhomboid family intramembrane serine protease, partial [Vicinamibacterales bacterium]
MPIVVALLLLAVFIGEVATGAAGSERALVPLGALISRGWSAHDWWRVVTFSFLHLNWLHLSLNTAGLLWLGRIVERRLGRRAFVAIFVVSGITSGIAGMLLGSQLPTTGVAVGASGAVCGLLAAAVIVAHRRDADRRLRLPLLTCLAAVVATSVLPGVSLAGHLGGF